MAKLTDKQQRFCDEYLIDLNATQAAIRAGYSVKTASEQGVRLLRNVKVQECIQERKKDRAERTEITQDRVLAELAAIAFSKATDYVKIVEQHAAFTSDEGVRSPLYDENGNPVMVQNVQLVLTENLNDTQVKAIAGIKQGKNGIELSMCNKERALEMLGRHLGMWTEKIELNGNVNNPFEGLTTEQLLKLAGDG